VHHAQGRALHCARDDNEIWSCGKARNLPLPSRFKIASAKMLRAELPVRMKSTSNALAAIVSSPLRTGASRG
jgi:hypothetical protein